MADSEGLIYKKVRSQLPDGQQGSTAQMLMKQKSTPLNLGNRFDDLQQERSLNTSMNRSYPYAGISANFNHTSVQRSRILSQ